MGAAAREEQVRRYFEEVWNRKNYGALASLYSEEYSGPAGSGIAAKEATIRRYHTSFPDLHIDVEEVVVGPDAVVARFVLKGTDLGGYAGRPPTGRVTAEWVVNILRFSGDRVVSEFIGADKLGMFIELGVVEDPWPKS